MKANKLVSLVLLFMGLSTHAAPTSDHGMGNGGDAVVCYTDATRSTITSVQMLDYWEQEQVVKYGKIDLGAANLSVQDKIQIAVNRIAKFDPELANKIKFNALNLANNIQNYLVTSYQLPEINDANPQVIPTQKNCFIEQYGVQYKDVITGQRRFAIADKFYNFSGTSNDDKVGLLLHEAIYRYAILQNPALNNSDGVRYFNYILASTRFDGMTLFDIDLYVNFLNSAGIVQKSCLKEDGYYMARQNELDKGKTYCEGLSINEPFYHDYKYTEKVLCYNSKINLKNSALDSHNYEAVALGGSCIEISKRAFENNISNISNIKILTPKERSSSNYINLKYVDQITKKSFDLSINKINFEFLGYFAPLSLENVQFYKYSKLNLSEKITFDNIASQNHDCDENSQVELNNLGNLISCSLNNDFIFNNMKYRLGKVSKYDGSDISIVNSNKNSFELLGSKNGILLVPSTSTKSSNYFRWDCSSNTVLTADLKLVQGCIGEDNFNFGTNVFDKGFNRKIVGNFLVEKNTSGIYTLNRRLSDVKIVRPMFQGNRLTYNQEFSPPTSNYCNIIGFDSSENYSENNIITSTYVMASGESVFNISNGKVEFKTDENLNIIEQLVCSDYGAKQIINY